MNFQLLPNVTPQEADIVILPIPHEHTVCAKGGTHQAPEEILRVSGQLEYYEEIQKWSPFKYMNVSVLDAVEVGAVQKTIEKIGNLEEKLLISLGGEHSITPFITPSVMKKGTIVFLDAHGDLRESYQGSPDSHACPAYKLLQSGHNLIQIGIRSIFESEAALYESSENITLFSDYDLQKEGVKKEMLDLLASLEGEVYLSIDMDAFSPAEVPGVGTPQPGGLSWYDGVFILEALFGSKAEIKGIDLVELVPEESEVSQVFTAKFLQKIISFWGKSKGFDTKEMSGIQMQLEYE